MAQKKMYPGVVNSPATELAANITATQTTIAVLSVAGLLETDGIATIGIGDSAETITYASVSGTTLQGCVRGFQGTARAWSAATRVARNFTAYDHDTFRFNIGDLDTSKLALVGGDMTGAIKRTYNSNVKSYRNVASTYFPAATQQGAAKIRLPKAFSGTAIKVVIQGHNHVVDGDFRLTVSGYTLTTQAWSFPQAILEGNAPFNAVTLGYDGANVCIILGGVTTTWSYATLEVTEVFAHISGTDGWETGWSIDLITDISGITKAVQPVLQKLATQAYADSVLTSAKADATVKASEAEANAKLYADGKLSLKMDAARPSNLLPNGSGVYGFTGWTFGGASTDWYAGKSSGDAPGEFSFRGASGAGARFIQSDPFPVVAGSVYNLSAEFWAENAGNDDLYIEILPAAGGGNFGAIIAQSTDRWNRRNVNVTIPAGVNSAILRLVVAPNKAASYKGFRRVQLTVGAGVKAWNDDSDGMALFQYVVNGKNDVKQAGILKGGAFNQAGSLPTFAELVAGINTIQRRLYTEIAQPYSAGYTYYPINFGFVPRAVMLTVDGISSVQSVYFLLSDGTLKATTPYASQGPTAVLSNNTSTAGPSSLQQNMFVSIQGSGVNPGTIRITAFG